MTRDPHIVCANDPRQTLESATAMLRVTTPLWRWMRIVERHGTHCRNVVARLLKRHTIQVKDRAVPRSIENNDCKKAAAERDIACWAAWQNDASGETPLWFWRLAYPCICQESRNRARKRGENSPILRYRTADLINLKQFDARTQNKYTLSEIRDAHTTCNYRLRLHSSGR